MAVKRKPGRPSKWSPEMRQALLVQLTLASDEAACKAVGISVSTLHAWMLKCEAGHPEFAGFSEEVLDARKGRYDAVLARLTDYHSYKADDAYLKHTVSRGLKGPRRRKAEAEADIAEANARKAKAEAIAAEAMANNASEGRMVVAGLDGALELLSPEVREQVERELAAAEVVRLSWRRDLLPREGEGA